MTRNGTFAIELPDLVVCRWAGRVGAAEVERLLDGLRATGAVPARPLVLCDVRHVTVVDERPRIARTLRRRGVQTRAVAFVGARFGVRALATLFVRTMGVFPRAPAVQFFGSEADARAWLAAPVLASN